MSFNALVYLLSKGILAIPLAPDGVRDLADGKIAGLPNLTLSVEQLAVRPDADKISFEFSLELVRRSTPGAGVGAAVDEAFGLVFMFDVAEEETLLLAASRRERRSDGQDCDDGGGALG